MITVPLASLTQPFGQIQEHVKLILDVRERYERRLNKDFNSTANDDRGDLLTRVRFGLETTPKSGPKMTLLYQYANDLIQTIHNSSSSYNSDMKLAQLDGSVVGDWRYTVGRQRINIGQERLIGSPEWSNLSRSYDGFRFRGDNWDLFGASIGLNSPGLHYARVAGATKTLGTSLNSFFYKHDYLSAGTVDLYTLDRQDSGSIGSLNWQYEAAYQFGRNLAQDHSAWALHGYLGHKITATDRIFAVGDYASGTGSADKSQTFDSLYCTPHGKWGLSDMVGWRNIALLSAGVEHGFTADTKIKFQYWKYWLANAKDGWYNASGILNKSGKTALIDPTGNSGRDLGSELDLELATRTGPVIWSFGVASFSPGSFVNNLVGHQDKQTWGYLQANYKF